MLASFKERMEAEGIDGKMYSHAIGDHGHAAGPTIGLADMNNQPVPVKGTPLSLFSCARIIYLSLCFCSFCFWSCPCPCSCFCFCFCSTDAESIRDVRRRRRRAAL